MHNDNKDLALDCMNDSWIPSPVSDHKEDKLTYAKRAKNEESANCVECSHMDFPQKIKKRDSLLLMLRVDSVSSVQAYNS